jgi:hypothetical protein
MIFFKNGNSILSTPFICCIKSAKIYMYARDEMIAQFPNTESVTQPY